MLNHSYKNIIEKLLDPRWTLQWDSYFVELILL